MRAVGVAVSNLILYNNAADIGKAIQALANGNPSQAVGLFISIGSSKSSSATQIRSP